ncbi:MAG: T9SS type A sorting domain-containing protein, partial [Candidatus Krumholzibacteria bacterium]|nr:T9SS type A sorting domain-containing protein [Candidatus Krumholzibacteria bacterium]
TYGHYASDDGVCWTVIQADTARSSGGYPVPDKYMFDLNDSLFTRGYMISYYFEAFDNAGKSSTLPPKAREKAEIRYGVYGTEPDEYYKCVSYIFEFTCLPTGSTDILYVDDFHGRGTFWGMTEQYLNPALMAVLWPEHWPDRYDVNQPSSLVSNGPGSRAKNYHMTTAYNQVIWDSGNLDRGTITDGTTYDSDKSNDCQLLVDWMEFSAHDCGLWVCGDDIASDLDGLTSAISLELLTTRCGVTMDPDPNAGSYFELTGGLYAGGVTIPLIVGAPSPSIFDHSGDPDSFHIDGGCPILNDFDVLEKAGNGAYALMYPDYNSEDYCTAIQSQSTNYGGYDVKTMWFGFSFMYILNCGCESPTMRNHITSDVLSWMRDIPGGTNPNPTGDETPRAYNLAQNFPNPFNPATKIKFDMKEKGLVTIRIYNVAGQLVRTLVNEVRDAGSYTEPWDGRNNIGAGVASGIYFYKMETKNFSRTRKMVLLK